MEGDLAGELEEEAGVHERARGYLAAMRERAAARSTEAPDEWSAQVLEDMKARRVAELFDDGRTPLFFGRLDYERDHGPYAGQSFHIGRCHVHDEARRPVVVDWRAGVSRAFYRATVDDRMGVVLRRRFGFSDGRLVSLETEQLQTGQGLGADRRALEREIERPRVGPMRDIVATIQPEQDDLIRAPVDETLVIQGSPGTGKTAVGLHRAAYLLYEHRQRLQHTGILVVGPNRSFMSYIGQVLPSLGERRVTERPLDDLVNTVAVRGTDSAEAASVKAGAVMAEVLRRAVFGRVALPEDSLSLRYQGGRVRLPAERLRALVAALLERDISYDAGRKLLAEQIQRDLLQVTERQGSSTGFDSQRDVARAVRSSEEARAFLQRTWPPLDAVKIVFELLTDRERLCGAAGGLLADDEQEALAWARRPRSQKAAPWSVADLYLIDEAVNLITRVPGFGHVVIDEAQDLSPMQLRALGRRCRQGSATLLGDLAQGTTPWALDAWEDALHHLGKPAAQILSLPRAFRAPRQVLDFASQLLPVIAPDVTAAQAVRDPADALAIWPASPDRLLGAAADVTRRAAGTDGSVGVIVADPTVAAVSAALREGGIAHALLDSFAQDARVLVVPASAAKGLEFDQVVVLEPADIAACSPRGLRLLYIALTRAVIKLWLVHSKALPAGLTPIPRSVDIKRPCLP